MADVFIGYAREDRETAQKLADALGERKFSVFWDKVIPPGLSFREVIEEEIAEASCALILWSRNSVRKDWVIDEAERAKDRRIYVPVILEENLLLPMGLKGTHWLELYGWEGDASGPAFEALVARVSKMVERPRAPVAVPKPLPGQLITDEHLVLIHSSKRRPDQDEKHGAEMYQIYVIVYGHRDVLERVEEVEYFLDPSYPTHYYRETDRSRNFRLKELANGYSVLRAKVKVSGQERKVELSRFINLSEHETDLSIFFGGWHGLSIGGK